MNHLVQRLLAGPRAFRVALYTLIDAFLVAIALWLAFFLRLESRWYEFLGPVLWIFPVAMVTTVISFRLFGLYRSPLRFASSAMLYRVVQAATMAALFVIASVFLLYDGVVPRGTMMIFWGLLIALPGVARMGIRDLVHHYHYVGSERRIPIVIYGAGRAGVQLATALAHSAEYHPVAFIDDAPLKRGQTIRGLIVHEPDLLGTLSKNGGVREVLVAIPSASRARLREVIDMLSEFPLVVRVVPSVEDIAAGRKRVDELHRIEIDDILGREAVSAMPELLSRSVTGRSVLVTGAGGSIGSELCRQILQERPSCLVLVENSEFALYSVSQEFAGAQTAGNDSVKVVSILADVCDRDRMLRIMRSWDVNVVFHAAAYKHVPIVELNATEGVRNNVFGTLSCALAAKEAGVSTFVLVSTDKAVRPTNVMGATKRLAEMILQALADKGGGPCYCAVRFGNVLASSGSVVPLFSEQIAKGGPITVTHPNVTRYFMTIPEAASLVVQAGAMCKGGDVFVLDMGEPVRIDDLARRMVHLAGLRIRDSVDPDGDIEIVYSGLRPGEKLHEELLIGDNVVATEHPMICRAEEEKLTWDALSVLIGRLKHACEHNDVIEVRRTLTKAVAGYSPEINASDLVSADQAPPRLRVVSGGSSAAETDKRA